MGSSFLTESYLSMLKNTSAAVGTLYTQDFVLIANWVHCPTNKPPESELILSEEHHSYNAVLCM